MQRHERASTTFRHSITLLPDPHQHPNPLLLLASGKGSHGIVRRKLGDLASVVKLDQLGRDVRTRRNDLEDVFGEPLVRHD